MRWILVGPRASGKSTLGRLLSKHWNLAFDDLDDLVTKHSSKSPTQWIEEGQEKIFRQWESQLLKQWLQENNEGILATGGGAIMHPESLYLLENAKNVIWLKNSAKTRQKIQESSPRPALEAGGLAKEIEISDWNRNALYQQVSNESVSTELGFKEVLKIFDDLKNAND
jgi:shikimate kinase